MAEEGVWRTIRGHRVFIDKTGKIHSNYKVLNGKKLSKVKKEEKTENEDISHTSSITKVEVIDKYKLTAKEVNTVQGYTENDYEDINNELRKNFGAVELCSKEVQEQCKEIDSLLSKLPKFEGTVVRQEPYDRDGYYMEGRTYINRAYTSTTAWTDSGGVVKLEIKQSSGCNISKLSSLPGENEVLLPRNFKYKVVKVEKDGNYTKVYAEEVKDA